MRAALAPLECFYYEGTEEEALCCWAAVDLGELVASCLGVRFCWRSDVGLPMLAERGSKCCGPTAIDKVVASRRWKALLLAGGI